MEIIWGSELSKIVKENLSEKVKELKKAGKRVPMLAVILVGDDPASQSYVKSKANACYEVGMDNETIRMQSDTTMEQLIAKIEELNHDDGVDGILVQLPLPKGLSREKAIMAIDPKKDVDGLHPMNAGAIFTGRDGFIPCTPKGIITMLESIGLDDLSGKRAVVCGRSMLVGKPVAMLLQNKNATVTVVHTRTKDIESITSQADILVVAAGVPKMVKASWVKEGAVVIDVGIHRMEDGKLCGDVDFEDVKEKTSAITPVPKGVGPMTVCMLLENTYQAYQYHEGANHE